MNEKVQKLVADYCHAVENDENLEVSEKYLLRLAEMGDAAVDSLASILLTVERPTDDFESIDWIKRECATYALIDIRTPRSIQEVLKAVELYHDWGDVDWDLELCRVSPHEFSIDLFAAALETFTDWEAKLFVIGAIDHGINHYRHRPIERALQSLVRRLEDTSQSQEYAVRNWALHTLKRYVMWSGDAAIFDVIKTQASDSSIGKEMQRCIQEIEKARKTKKSG